MDADKRQFNITLSTSLADEVDRAVDRGDASTRDEFVANAVQHELLRLRDAATAHAAPLFAAADNAPPEEVGIGWEGLMPKADETRKQTFGVKPEDTARPS